MIRLIILLVAMFHISQSTKLAWSEVSSNEKSLFLPSIENSWTKGGYQVIRGPTDPLPVLDTHMKADAQRQDGELLLLCSFKNSITHYSAYFFVAMVSNPSPRLARFGSLRTYTDQTQQAVFQSVQAESEVYCDRNPYAFNEHWVEDLDFLEGIRRKIPSLNQEHQLQRVWLLPGDKLIAGIFSFARKFYFTICSLERESADLKIRHLGDMQNFHYEVEEELAQYLVSLTPFACEQYFEVGEAEAMFGGKLVEKLKGLIDSRAARNNIPQIMNKYNLVRVNPRSDDYDQFIVLFRLDDQQNELWVMIGAESVQSEYPVLTHVAYGKSDFDLVKSVKNCSTIAFSKEFKSREERWCWAWNIDAENDFYGLGLPNLEDDIIAAAPFTVRGGIYLQKVRLLEGGKAIGIYICRERLFFVAFGNNSKSQTGVKYIGALGSEPELLSSYKKYLASPTAFQDAGCSNGINFVVKFPAEVTASFEEVFEDLIANSTMLKEYYTKTKIEPSNTEMWLVEDGCGNIARPFGKIADNISWFALLCKVQRNAKVLASNIVESSAAEGHNEHVYFYVIATYDDGKYAGLKHVPNWPLYSSMETLRKTFRDYVRSEHDLLVAKAKLEYHFQGY